MIPLKRILGIQIGIYVYQAVHTYGIKEIILIVHLEDVYLSRLPYFYPGSKHVDSTI